MKILKLFGITLTLGIFLIACGNTEESTSSDEKDVTEESANDATNEKINEVSSEKSKDCEEYLDNFEKWADKYIVLLKKVKSNPSDPSIMSEYAKLAPEMGKWAMEWQEKIYCAQDEAFVNRYEKITKRIEDEADTMN